MQLGAARVISTSGRAAFAAGDGARVHVAEIAPDGMPVVTDMDLAAPPAASPSGAPRDWPAALGVRLDDAGQPAAFDP